MCSERRLNRATVDRHGDVSCLCRASKRGAKYCAPVSLHEFVSARLLAEELDVNGAAETRIEEYVQARMVVVVIDVDAVAVPFPVAAARNIVGREDPIGLVVENDVPRARIEAADHNHMTNVRVTPVRIVVAGSNALAIVIPLVVITVVMLVPALVLAVVVAVAVVIIIVVAVLVPALVFAVVVVLRAGQDSSREGKYRRSKSQQCKELFHVLLSQRSLIQEWAYSRCPLLRVGVGWGWYDN